MAKCTFIPTLAEKSFWKSGCQVVTYGTELGQGLGLRGAIRNSQELCGSMGNRSDPTAPIQMDCDTETLAALIITDLVCLTAVAAADISSQTIKGRV